MTTSIPREGNWPPPLTMSAVDVESDHDDEMDGRPPVHPVPTMQGAFEESMMETLNETDQLDPSDRYSIADSVSRRKMLLEQAEYERTVAGRWKQKPGEKFHPLWKLVAQISFGIHLLQQGLAKSEEDVIKILQTHVDDVDGFLERTTEDFELAQGDINERIRYLRLPLEHGQVFDGMLNDRSFRISIVEGNEKIEHIIDRTAAAMTDALKDVQKGLDATRELAKYLTRVDKRWDHRTDEHDSVYLAMIGNTEGWTRAFLSLQSKGNALRKALVQLRGIVAEMQKRAGAASRKNLVAVRSINGRYYVEKPTSSRNSISPPKSPLKPLPKAPDPTIRPSKSQKSPHLSVETSSRNSKHREPKHKEPSSPYLEQAVAAKRVEPVMRVTSSERGDPTKSPKSVISAKSIEPTPSVPATQPTATVPQRSLSRKGSISERTRSMTRKFSFFKDSNENDQSHSTSTHGTHAQQNTVEKPLSSVRRRLSSRKGDAASLSTYSTSPTSPTKRKASPIVREASPPYVSKSEEPVPTQSSYGSLPLLPVHSAISPLTESSFIFGQESWPQPHNRSLSDQRPMPTVLRRDDERSTNASHPLANEVFQEKEESDIVSHNALAKGHDGSGIHVKSSPSLSETKTEIETNPGTSRSVLRSAETNGKRDLNESHQPPTASDIDAEWNFNTAHALLVAAQESLKRSERPCSPAISELEAPLPSSHPLLLETRQSEFSSKTAPSTPPRHPARDLPLRHYYSQEQFQSPGFSSLRQKEADAMPKRSSSVLQRGSTQFSPDVVKASIASQSQPITSLPPPNQPSTISSPLRLVTDMTNTNSGSSNLSHDSKPVAKIDPSLESSSEPTQSINPTSAAPGPSSSPIGAESFIFSTNTEIRPTNATTTTMNSKDTPTDIAAMSPNADEPPGNIASIPTDTIATPTTAIADSTIAKTSSSAYPTHKRSPSSQDLDPAAKYKTSATSNIPFYLNPVSSAALVDFLSSTPPSSSPHPGIQVCPYSQGTRSPPTDFEHNATIDNTFSPQTNVLTYPGLAAPAPPLPSSHNETPAIPFEPQTDTPRSSSSSPVVEKKPKWRKVFGSRGAARQKGPKTGPEVVIVGKGEWYKIERKKKGHGQSKGSEDLKVTKDTRPADENIPTATTTVEAGFMGVGKDGVWISRKNFVKT